MNELKQEWDSHWSAQSNTISQRDVYYILDEIKLSYLKSFLPPTGKSLEVGCGSARLSLFLAQQGYQTYGIDYSSLGLKVAQTNYQLGGVRGEFVEGNAFQLPFKDESFDVVLSTGLLEHFEDPLPIVREMTRVLRPNGVFYSDIVPQKLSSLRLLDRFKRTPDVFERSFSQDDIRALLQAAELTDSVVFPAGVMPPLWFPFVHRWQTYQALHTAISDRLKPLLTRLDGTPVAEWLGFYYLCFAHKGQTTR